MVTLIVGLLVGSLFGSWWSERSNRHRARRRKILELLERQSLYGLQLVDQSRGLLARGTVYIVLNDMEQEGLLVSQPEPNHDASRGGIPRRIYALTGAGRDALADPYAGFPPSLRSRLGTS